VALRLALVYGLLAPLAAPDHLVVAPEGHQPVAALRRIGRRSGASLYCSAESEATGGAALLALEHGVVSDTAAPADHRGGRPARGRAAPPVTRPPRTHEGSTRGYDGQRHGFLPAGDHRRRRRQRAGRWRRPRIVEIAEAAVDGAPALHGGPAGGTPRGTTYERLAAPPLREQMPWDRTWIFFGDERVWRPIILTRIRNGQCRLLSKVPVPAAQVGAHPRRGEGRGRGGLGYGAPMTEVFGAAVVSCRAST